ncbi:MAG: HEAT repeat domain-containing protein [Thermoguttaceae bacterium]
MFRRFFLFLLLLFVFGLISDVSAQERLTPESPQVKEAISRAIAYLDAKGLDERRTGGLALMGLALLKAGAPTNHPVIRRATEAILSRLVENPAQNPSVALNKFDYPIYSIGMSAMFLSELDAEKYSREIDQLAVCIQLSQQLSGGWGYLNGGTVAQGRGGDMSMTQYSILGAWMIAQSGGDVSSSMMINVGKWLLAVQDSNGGYAYTSQIGARGEVQRDAIRLSTTAAGMSSVYVLRDYYGLTNVKIPLGGEGFEIPPVFRRVRPPDVEELQRATIKTDFTERAFKEVLERGNEYLEKGFVELDPKMNHFYYYLYAMERYFSFKEIADRKIARAPEWYDKMAKCLIENQSAQGSWDRGCGSNVDTAYGILVLCRSTRQTLSRGMDGGNMRGGQGLPDSTDELSIQDGQVVSVTDPAQVEELMDRLDLMNDLDQQSAEKLAHIPQAEIEKILRRNSQPVAKLVRSRYPELRQIAAQTLGASGSVDNVPTLLILLNDVVPDVAVAAQNALCLLTRHPRGKPLPEPGSIGFESARAAQHEFWRNWYLTLLPRAEISGPEK